MSSGSGSAASNCLITSAAVNGLFVYEAHTSRLQARFLTRYAASLQYQSAPGASDQMRFPTHGPFDQRLGYTAIPDVVSRLAPRGFVVTEQVRQSPELLAHLDRGLYAPYAEKSRAGLAVLERGREMVAAQPSRFIAEMALDKTTAREDPREKLKALRAEFALKAQAAAKAA